MASDQGYIYAPQAQEGGFSYGGVDDDGAIGQKMNAMVTKSPFLRSQRKRLNVVPLFICIGIPWVVFTVVEAVLSFRLHHDAPGLSYSILGAAALVTLAIGCMALTASGRRFVNAEHEPTWLVFLFGSVLIAYVLAFVAGNRNYSHLQKYFDVKNLNNYTDISPAKTRGQQVMDAGVIQFTPEARLDLTKSMGFTNGHIYCVAPITTGSTPLASYDFWVVGTDCCSGNMANFHCANFNNPRANGGLRLMSDSSRSFFRLAVQQAEAAYSIKAAHPLFFSWEQDPFAIVDSWKHAGRTDFFVWMLTYLIFQTFVVAVATLTFAKMGHF